MKRTGKKFLSMLMVLVMCLGMFPTSVFATEYDYEVNDTAVTHENVKPAGNIPNGTEWTLTDSKVPYETEILGLSISYSSVCGYNEHTHNEKCFDSLTCHAHGSACASNWTNGGNKLTSACGWGTCEGHLAHYEKKSGFLTDIYYATVLDQCSHDHIAEGCFAGKKGETALYCGALTLGKYEEHTHDVTCSEYTWTLTCLHKNYEAVETVAPTCTEDGYTVYACTTDGCGDTYTETAAKLEHNYELTDSKDVTCTEAGYKKYTCKNDAEHTYTDIIEATGHAYEDDVTAPTCEDQGYTTYTCHCGDTYVDDYTDALGHDWDEGEVTTAPTCTESGVKT